MDNTNSNDIQNISQVSSPSKIIEYRQEQKMKRREKAGRDNSGKIQTEEKFSYKARSRYKGIKGNERQTWQISSINIQRLKSQLKIALMEEFFLTGELSML